LASTTSLLLFTVFGAVHVALIAVKLRSKDAYDGFRIPLVVPVVGLVFNLGMMPFAKPASMRIAIGILAVGLVVVAVQWLRPASAGTSVVPVE
jgi:hypothetical protein